MHPLRNGSQATERPAAKPLTGLAGWFTESGDDNKPSYPGADWFNHVIAEFQNALVAAGIVFDPNTENNFESLVNVLKNAAYSREQLEKNLGLNSRIYPEVFNGNLNIGDSIPSLVRDFGVTHLVIDGNVYLMSQTASGEVLSIDYDSEGIALSANIGGDVVIISNGYELRTVFSSQIDVERMINNEIFRKCVLTTVGTIDIHDLNLNNRCEIIGIGEDSAFKLSQVGTCINAKAIDPSVSALANIKLEDFQIDMDFLANSIGIDMAYSSLQSLLSGVRISNIGNNSIGLRLSKEWYATTKRCSIRSSDNTNDSIGVLVATDIGQVNDIPIDFQINNVGTGLVVDTTDDYVYKLVIPNTFHAERCKKGMYVKSGRGVRQAIISGYFEANDDFDVQWGDPVAGVENTQTVLWQSASFNPTGSKVILYEGNHIFDGCDRINVLEVHRAATVEIRGGIVNSIINTTGNPNAVRYRPTSEYTLSKQTYAKYNLLHPKVFYAGIVSSAASVVFSFVNEVFSALPANGRSAKVLALSRRTYDSNTLFFEFIITQNASGVWGLTLISSSPASTAPTINSSGDVTINDTRSDTKVFSIEVTPL